LTLAVVAALGACGKRTIDAPLFPLDACKRVTLTDEMTGARIAGAEDLDIDLAAGRIFVSAYDRRAVEKAAARRAPAIPQGGVYSINLTALRDAGEALSARPLINPVRVAGGLRPHGLSFDRASGALTFINRGYERDERSWRLETAAIAFVPEAPDTMKVSPVACPANDVTTSGGRLLVTLDHGACGWRAAIEDFLGARGGSVVDETGVAVLTGLGFANGAVATTTSDLAVAATRERAIHLVDVGEGEATVSKTLRLSGAPDNLTTTEEGRLVAAVHPRLLAIGLQRKLGVGRSPSRIIEIDPASGDQRLLFDDPKATLISAATAAVLSPDFLVIGSVVDEGIAVCRRDVMVR
jgi:hypothetical protein